jgi:hypothetical protein
MFQDQRTFIRDMSGDLWRLKWPRFTWLTEKPTWWERRIPGAMGAYEELANEIMLLPGASWGLIAHELGHWAIYRFHLFVTACWQIPWWMFSVRRLFMNHRHLHTGDGGK